MDIDAMTVEERSSLMKKGACFYCKEQGHISKDCPKKKKKKNYEPKYSKKDMATYIRGMTTEQKEAFATELINDNNGSNNEDF